MRHAVGLFVVAFVSSLSLLMTVRTVAAQETAPCHEVFELSLSSDQAYDNPFTETTVVAKFTSPVGKVVPLEGFYFGGTEWRVRFVPDAVGTWKYEVTLTGKGAPVTKAGVFECVKSDRHGFIRISKKNPYRFEHLDGTPFYPVGQQPGMGLRDKMPLDGEIKGQDYTVDGDTYVKAFTGATNLIRCTMGFVPGDGSPRRRDLLEPGHLDRYSLDGSAQKDQAGQTLKKHGWAQLVTLFADMSLWGNNGTAFGPPQDVRGEWKSLTSPKLPQVERYLRYIVARFGAYTDIWEMFNEDSYAPNDWLAHLAKVIRDADPYDHPICTSYERPDQPWCEIACPHQYVKLHAKDIGGYLSKEYAYLKSFGKPVQFTEFGNKNVLSNYDPVKWRQAAWVSYMNECGMLYFVMQAYKTGPSSNPNATGNANAYLGPDSRQHLRVLNEFNRDLPVTMRPIWAGYDGRLPVDTWALGDDKYVAVYLNHRETHDTEVKLGTIPVWTGPGRFRMKWIDPETGDIIREQDTGTRQFVLWLPVPTFKVDIACRLERITTDADEVPEDTEEHAQ